MLQTPFEISGDLTSVEDGDTFLHDLATETSAVVDHIGDGTLDDPLYTITIGTGQPRVAVLASIHGNEPACREAAYGFIRDMAYGATPTTASLVADHAWTFLPTPNPSGIRHGWRQPSNDPSSGDLNRDFGEQRLPESQAMASWLSDVMPALVVDLHEHLGTTIPDQIATGRQTHTGTHPAIRPLSDELNTAVADRVQADGYTWSLYPDSTITGTARTEVGRLYKSACVLGETDRTIDLATRVGANLSLLDESAVFWMARHTDFETAHHNALYPPTAGLYRADGTPVALSAGTLYYADGTPVTG